MLRPGELLNDRYRLDTFVASGGMGEVWRATDVILGRTVAVKVLLPALLTDPDFAARFRAEARILAAFRHPNVVDVYDFGESPVDGGQAAYLVMAYVDGEPLSHRIASAGRLPVVQTLSVVAQAADALDVAHSAGVVHRDVKPGNLLVQEDGTVVLVDFGVARSADITAITAANAVPGTVLYMAPEQVTGKPVQPTTDVYALGAVAYQCVAGVPPFNGEAPMEIALRHLNDEVPPLPDDVPAPVRALIMRALAKDPADRFQTAAALAAAARAAAVAVGGQIPGAAGTSAIPTAGPATAPLAAPQPFGSPTSTRPDIPVVAAGQHPVGAAAPAGLHDDPPAVGPAGRPGSRRRAAALAGAAAVVLAGASLAVALLLQSNDEDNPSGPDTPAGSSVPASTAATQPGAGRTGDPGRTARGSTAPAQQPSASEGGGNPPASEEPGESQPPATEPAPGPSGSGGNDDGDDDATGAPVNESRPAAP